jgi:non-ribosomal peptide synthetase component F
VILLGDDVKVPCSIPSTTIDSPKSSAGSVADLMMPFGEIHVSKTAYIITTSGSTGKL